MNPLENGSNDKPDSDNPEPENALERILKEKFGDTRFGGLMDSIMDQMMKGLAQKDGEKSSDKAGAEEG